MGTWQNCICCIHQWIASMVCHIELCVEGNAYSILHSFSYNREPADAGGRAVGRELWDRDFKSHLRQGNLSVSFLWPFGGTVEACNDLVSRPRTLNNLRKRRRPDMAAQWSRAFWPYREPNSVRPVRSTNTLIRIIFTDSRAYIILKCGNSISLPTTGMQPLVSSPLIPWGMRNLLEPSSLWTGMRCQTSRG
jgi:hypothetical protein